MKAFILSTVIPCAALGYSLKLNHRYIPPSILIKQRCTAFRVCMNDGDEQQSEGSTGSSVPKLLLSTTDVDAHMANLRSKYPTSEADYLAAARARNAAKQASSERTATDADWRQMAEEKKQAVGEIDDWEKSMSEAGNKDSQILIPLTSSIGEDGEEEEPKLMLF